VNKSHRARVALVGLGPIGIEVGKALVGRRNVEILGAADPAPDKAGVALSDLVAGGPSTPVDGSAAALYSRSAGTRSRSDVVVLCTRSRLAVVVDQIEEAVAARMHVVSTCEELA
jgi:hypothetical protein